MTWCPVAQWQSQKLHLDPMNTPAVPSHLDELLGALLAEGPLRESLGGGLAAPFAGDAEDFEGHPVHGLGLRVHFHTASPGR